MELCFCAVNKNQQKEGCQCGIKTEKLCAFRAVHVQFDAFHGTALKEEVEIHASLTWATLHPRNMPALSKRCLLKALAMLSRQLLSIRENTFAPVAHLICITLASKALTLQTAPCSTALKSKIHSYVRACFSQLHFAVKY